MKKFFIGALALGLSLHSFSQETKDDLLKKKVVLPNGWTLTPAGTSLPLGDLPLNIAVSSSGHYVAVTNNGQSTQTIELIDIRAQRVLDTVIIPKSWLGLKFSADEKWLYASAGNDNQILKYAVNTDPTADRHGLVLADSIVLGKRWPEKISPSGIEIDDKRDLLYVVTKENNSLYIADLNTRTVLQRLDLGGEGYTCKLSRDKKELYITCWGCDKLLIFDTEKRSFTGTIAVGD